MYMNEQLRERILRAAKRIAVPYYRTKTSVLKRMVSRAYRSLYYAEWCIDNPENFDHQVEGRGMLSLAGKRRL